MLINRTFGLLFAYKLNMQDITNIKSTRMNILDPIC